MQEQTTKIKEISLTHPKDVQSQAQPELQAMAYQQQAMATIIHQMREIPELPSEAPKDVETLYRVEFPDEGGVLTYMSNNDYPYRGFPFSDFVEKIDTLKKISRGALSGLYHALKENRLSLFTLIPAVWVIKKLIRVVVYIFYRIIERFRVKKGCYCTALRELYRSFGEGTEFRQQLRDLVCMVLEFDNAYRFRFQDIIAELDKNAARKDIAKEITRLFGEMQKRENGQDIKDTWKLVKLFIRFYLKFDKELREILRDICLNIDIKEASLDPSDKHYCAKRKDYTFPWITNALSDNPTVKQDRLIIEKIYLRDAKKEKENAIKKDYIELVDILNTRQAEDKKNNPNIDYFEKHGEEQQKLIRHFDPIIERVEEWYKKSLEELNNKYN